MDAPDLSSTIAGAFSLLLVLGCLLLGVLLVALIAVYGFKASRYRKTRYAQATRNPCWKVMFDKGAAGEFMLGRRMEEAAPEGKMFFNLYIPKPDGSTSEVDALLIAPTGIYVFENKNYSGWIFGRAEDKVWTQTFNRRSKYHFLNPIIQNAGHVKALKGFLKLPDAVFQSIIVFSDAATLKKVAPGNAIVIKTAEVPKALMRLSAERPDLLTGQQIDLAYASLRSCANASRKTKRAHADRIRKRP